MVENLFWIVPISSSLALFFAYYFFKQMMRQDEGTDRMKAIALYVRQGAMAYLRQQYKVVGLFFLGLTAVFAIMAYGFNYQNHGFPLHS